MHHYDIVTPSSCNVWSPASFETSQAVAIVRLFDHFGRGRAAAIRILMDALVHHSALDELLALIVPLKERQELGDELRARVRELSMHVHVTPTAPQSNVRPCKGCPADAPSYGCRHVTEWEPESGTAPPMPPAWHQAEP